MAMIVESVDQSSSGFKVEGDLGDLQIIEDSGEEEDIEDVIRECGKNHALSIIPNGLVKASTTPIFGAVQITNSDNTQFGNNTYFNGPVTIKQVIQTSSEYDNTAYHKTEDENISNRKCDKKKEYLSKQRCQIKTWHKLLFSAVGVIVLGSICAVVIATQQKNEQSNNISDNHDSSSTDDLLIAPDHLRVVSRTDWLAQPVVEKIGAIRQPMPWVIITHTATESCFTQSSCVLRVRLMQTFHIESKNWSDIAYNFLVGGDGSAYCGRGWDQIGAHTKGYNKYAISIAFIGTFNTETPTKHQVDACKKLIKQGVAQGKLAKDYKLLTHRQLMSTLSPGDKVFEIVKTWPHFYNDTDISAILPKY